MLIFICVSCGRFGIAVPRENEAGEVTAECPFCGNDDIDWMSRHDLSTMCQRVMKGRRRGENLKETLGAWLRKNNPKRAGDLMKLVEFCVVRILNNTYDVYDEACKSITDVNSKVRRLEEVFGALQKLL